MKQLHNIYVYEPILSKVEEPKSYIIVELHPEKPNWLRLHLPYELVTIWLSTVKNIPGRRWDAADKVWEIPYTKVTIRFLNHYLKEAIQLSFTPRTDIPERYQIDKKPAKPIRKLAVEPALYENAVTALEECLMLKRYSWRTIKSYKNCLRQFIRYYEPVKPSQLTRSQIHQFLLTQIKERNISVSYQSQMLSAIKMFYKSVVKQEEKVRDLFQPKPEKKIQNDFIWLISTIRYYIV